MANPIGHFNLTEDHTIGVKLLTYEICSSLCWKVVSHAKHKSGYIYLWYEGTKTRAHCIIWKIINKKKIPKGMVVMHTCNNKSCINPAHLRLGTQAQNARQAELDGLTNHPKGEECSYSKLSEEQVRQIKFFEEGKQSDIAKRYKVNQTLVLLGPEKLGNM